ncbi:MAG: magnesium transporter, partial [Actinobacteria bacterium]|nr:magnesium transporter [Actinomycetota bacterium]
MTTTDAALAEPTVLLSGLLKHAVLDAKGQDLGQIVDAVVRLHSDAYPPLTGLLMRIGAVDVLVPVDRVEGIGTDRIQLLDLEPDPHPVQRRPGEVLLSGDLLGHRLVDLTRAVLVRAYDAQLNRAADGWILTGLDVHKRRFLHHLVGRHDRHAMRDWRTFEPLLGHQQSMALRTPFSKLGRLKPAQLADLVEEASAGEQQELLAHVHTDPELEADVFEELEEDQLTQLLQARTVEQAAEVIGRMRADDAADAVMELPQDKRLPVLENLPEPQRTKVRTLLGYHDATAGGLMGMDYIAASDHDSVEKAIGLVRTSPSQQPEALTTIFSLDENGRLAGA